MELGELSQLKAWQADRGNLDIAGFIASEVSVTEAAALVSYLWPEFLEFQGGVFLKVKFDAENVTVWLDQLGNDRQAVEVTVNHIHLWDLFAPKDDKEHAALEELAQVMANMWRAAARAAFPGREFLVTVSDDYGPGITLRSA
jgi:hypothetical protein